MSATVAGIGDDTLRERITHALAAVEADPEADGVRKATLRLILCAVRDRDASERAADRTMGCCESEISAILAQMVAQRKASAIGYEDAGRPELAERERAEIAVISEFLPRPLDDKELAAAAAEVVDRLGASGLKDLGRCMGELKARYDGRLDPAKAGAAVKSLLTS